MISVLCSGVHAVLPCFAWHSESFIRVPVFVVAKAPMKDIERQSSGFAPTAARCCGAIPLAPMSGAKACRFLIALQRPFVQLRPGEGAPGAGGAAGVGGAEGVAGVAGGLRGTCSIILSVSCWPGERSPLPMSGSSMRCRSGVGVVGVCVRGAILIRSRLPARVQQELERDLPTQEVEKLVDKWSGDGLSD